MTSRHEAALDAAVEAAWAHSDMRPEALRHYGRAFLRAHDRVPAWAPSLEIGTRKGGSALLALRLLEALYPTAQPPLFTVDPYGDKPYQSGLRLDGRLVTVTGDYGAAEYLAMKQLLAPFANHHHFYLEGITFLAGVAGQSYWHDGIERQIDRFACTLLDGGHDVTTVLFDLELALKHTAPGGVIVIDNADRDQELPPALQRRLSDRLYEFDGEWFPNGDSQVVVTRRTA